MVGHYLLTLTPDEEGRVLTTKLCPGDVVKPNGDRCLTGAVQDFQWRGDGCSPHARYPKDNTFLGAVENWPGSSVPMRFDALCERFGVERINAAIRNRILSNQARRALTGQRHAVMA